MRVLITGITGMAGSHLAEYLLEAEPGVQITGSVRWRSRMQDLAAIERHLRLVECDVRDRASVDRLMAQARPDFCFHLAAQSSVSASFHSPSETLVTNISGLVNVLESLRLHAPDCRVLVPGSSEEYGASEGLVDERSPLLPLSPYAVSKVTQDLIGFQYHQSYKLHIIRMRAFNHTGPRRPALYAESDFARQIAAIEGGAEPVIRVGNLEAVRDYTDVRDVVRGYWLALRHGVPGEVYNIGSGRGRSIREVLEGLLACARV
ncbi:MAG TPA: GDP-mannose 4,6-dehydratase, partial [Candidatus Nitrosotenuis sp.]|nr:GDP-mannose 4,6-dehydratase [Candidatus Nitrosotenuis sp.]